MALVNTKKSALLLSADATTPTAGDFLEVTEPIIVSPTINGGEYSRITGKLNTGNQRYNDLNYVTASFTATAFMRSSNVAGTALDTPPEIANALKVSGFDEAVVAITSVTYSNSQAPVGGTALIYVDGKKYSSQAGSVVANPEFTFAVGQPAQVKFDMQCFLTSATPTAEANPTVALSAEPLVIVSSLDILTYGGTVVKADSVRIVPNNTIDTFYTLGGANSLKDIEILDNGYTMTATFFVDSASFDTDYADLESQGLKAVEIKLGTGSGGTLVNGKSILINATKVEVQNVADSTDKDRVKRTVTYRLQNDSTAGDKAITIKYGTVA